MHDEVRSGMPTIKIDEIVEQVYQTLCNYRKLLTGDLFDEFPHIGQIFIDTIVSEEPGYYKLCARCLLKILPDQHEKKMCNGRAFLEKMKIISFHTLLQATKSRYPTSKHNRKSSQCIGVIQVHQNR